MRLRDSIRSGVHQAMTWYLGPGPDRLKGAAQAKYRTIAAETEVLLLVLPFKGDSVSPEWRRIAGPLPA